MNSNTNISKKKVWKAIIAFASLCLVLGLVIYAYSSRNKGLAQGLHISFVKEQNPAINKERIMTLLDRNGLNNITSAPIASIDIQKIEKILLQDYWIKKAIVFMNNKDQIQVDITLRDPVARIYYRSGKSAYLSSDLIILPANIDFAYYIPVFTNVPYLGSDEMSQRIKNTIASAGSHILRDTFWNAQFTQLYINDNLHILANTVMGDHVVKLGDTARFQEKLNNLFSFFKYGLTKVGFQQYEVIDASYKGQIITSPGMGYVTPVMSDTVVSIPDEDILTLHKQNSALSALSSDTTHAPKQAIIPTAAPIKPVAKTATKKIETKVTKPKEISKDKAADKGAKKENNKKVITPTKTKAGSAVKPKTINKQTPDTKN